MVAQQLLPSRGCTARALRAVALVVGVVGAGAVPVAAHLTSFPEFAIDTTLAGDGQSPAAATTAVGQCNGRLVPAVSRLVLTCSSDVAGAGQLVLSDGPPAGGGTTVLVLGGGAVVGADVTLNETQVALLLVGRLYLSVASAAYPQGEVAARVFPRQPLGDRVMRFPLANDELVASGSAAHGNCILLVHPNHSNALICTHDVASPQQLQVILDNNVVGTVGATGNPLQASLPVLGAQYARFLDGDFGVVLTSLSRPQGELGMVLDRCLGGPDRLCLHGERFAVSVLFTQPGQAAASAHPVAGSADDSGLFWFFGPSNWEATVKVLDGCGLNNHFWVFLSANTNVAFTATVFDTLTGAQRAYSNPQGTVAVPVADTSAISCGD
jgi:hypothetical protein